MNATGAIVGSRTGGAGDRDRRPAYQPSSLLANLGLVAFLAAEAFTWLALATFTFTAGEGTDDGFLPGLLAEALAITPLGFFCTLYGCRRPRSVLVSVGWLSLAIMAVLPLWIEAAYLAREPGWASAAPLDLAWLEGPVILLALGQVAIAWERARAGRSPA